MPYAEGTTVPMEKSIGEIVALVKKAGATRVGQIEEADSYAIQFFMNERMVRFRVKIPVADAGSKRGPRPASAKELAASDKRRAMQRARALLLVIKAKLESVESEVETFEEAFLPNLVMADGATLYERVQQPIALEYAGGKPVPMLLEGPRS